LLFQNSSAYRCRYIDELRGLPVTVAAAQPPCAADRRDALVQLSDINVRFGGITALEGVNFEFVTGCPTAEGLGAPAPRGRAQRGEGS
jgi:hypothetical protein